MDSVINSTIKAFPENLCKAIPCKSSPSWDDETGFLIFYKYLSLSKIFPFVSCLLIFFNSQFLSCHLLKILFSYNNEHLAIQQSSLVALAGQTRGAIGLSLNFLVTFSFKRKSNKQKKSTERE
jgi:hypothetical protein